jgi:hypothetical protein
MERSRAIDWSTCRGTPHPHAVSDPWPRASGAQSGSRAGRRLRRGEPQRLLLARRPEDRLQVHARRRPRHLDQRRRRLSPHPARELRELHGHAPLVARRQTTRLRLSPGRQLGPLPDGFGGRSAPSAHPGALGGCDRHLVPGRTFHLLPLRPQRSHGAVEDAVRRGRRRSVHARRGLLRDRVTGRALRLLLEELRRQRDLARSQHGR